MAISVMYHNVGKNPNQFLKKIPTITVDHFNRQLDYLSSKYVISTLEDFLFSENCSKEKVLLTFDDGLLSHYEIVYPILRERGLQGTFFVSGMPLVEKKILNVHLIQIIMGNLSKDVFDFLNPLLKSYLLSADEISEKYPALHVHRFDNAEVALLKKYLQLFLPEEKSREILGAVIKKFYKDTEFPRLDSIYMSYGHLREMASGGMVIGGHSYSHRWMEYESQAKNSSELISSKEFLEEMGVQIKTFCYPYGSFNTQLKNDLMFHGYEAGFTVVPKIITSIVDERFAIPRFDARDRECNQQEFWK
jgi:peptidoglycan/xylan/chitin deacetylase (PgdA/CDA1 family)